LHQLFQPVPVANEVGKTLRQFEHWAILTTHQRLVPAQKYNKIMFIGFDLDQLSARFRPALSLQFVSGLSISLLMRVVWQTFLNCSWC
jgi:hypothetical protein